MPTTPNPAIMLSSAGAATIRGDSHPHPRPPVAEDPTGGGWSRAAQWVEPGLFGSVLVFATVVLVAVNRGHWFHGDEWAFIIGTDLGHDPWRTLMLPHNEHWSALPILVWRSALHVFGLHSYWPYVAILVVMQLAMTVVLWRMLLRVGSARSVALTLCAAFAVLGAGAQNLTWAFQIGFIGSVLFGYLAIWAADSARLSVTRTLLGWLAAVAGLMCSGIGPVMLLVVGVTAGLRAGWRAALITLSVPGSVFVLWYLNFGTVTTVGTDHGRARFLALPDYMVTGLTSSLTAFVGLPGAGTVIVLGLGWWLFGRRRHLPDRAAVAIAGALGSMTLYLVIGVGRVSVGVDQSEVTRYSYIAVALLLPAMALALSAALGNASRLAIAALGLFLIAHNVYLLQHFGAWLTPGEQRVHDQVQAAVQLAESGEPVLLQKPLPNDNPDITLAGLREVVRRGWLTEPGGSDETALLTVRARTQVNLSARPVDAARLPAMNAVSVATAQATPGPAGCVVYTPQGGAPQLEYDVPASGGSVRLDTSVTGNVSVALAPAGGGAAGAPATFTIRAGTPEMLEVVAGGYRAVVTLPTGEPTTVCR